MLAEIAIISCNSNAAVVTSFPLPSSDDMTCQRKRIDLCDTNCKDHLYQTCESEIIYDCGCETGKHLSQNGTCVTPDQCGCYDFTQPDLYLSPGEESINGCKDW